MRYAAGSVRYAGECLRYAEARVRYADGSLRYAAMAFRYADGPIRYAGARVRYGDERLRYASRRFRYAKSVRSGLKGLRESADESVMQLNHVRPAPPVSNTERQRRFRQRNPGYYGRLHRARKAEAEQCRVARLALAAQQAVSVADAVPLMLPAPVEETPFDGVALLKEFEAEVARRAEAGVLIELKHGEPPRESLHLTSPVR